MCTVQATRSAMCPMTDQLTAGPADEVSVLFASSMARTRAREKFVNAVSHGLARARENWNQVSTGVNQVNCKQ